MEMLKVAGIAVAAALSCCVVRRMDAGIGMALALCAGTMVVLCVLTSAAPVVASLQDLTALSGVRDEYVAVLLKVVGVCFLAELAAGVCRDAQEEGLAQKVELAGRVLTMALGLPVLTSLLREILELVP